MAEIIFRYFRSVEGKVVPRYGTAIFIGVKRDKVQGWVWNTDLVVRIPESETTRYLREYRRALEDGSMTECARVDYEAQNTEVRTEVREEPTEVVRRRRQKGEED